MTGAPAWLTFVTAAISVTSLMISLATYRRAGPRVRVVAKTPGTLRHSLENFDIDLHLTVYNSGLAPVDIVSTSLAGRVSFLSMSVLRLDNADMYEGVDLPYRLEPGSSRTLIYSLRQPLVRSIGQYVTTKKWPGRSFRINLSSLLFPFSWSLDLLFPAVVVVDLGNGVQVSSNRLYSLILFLYRYIALTSKDDKIEN
jgi:hypothetical protein